MSEREILTEEKLRELIQNCREYEFYLINFKVEGTLNLAEAFQKYLSKRRSPPFCLWIINCEIDCLDLSKSNYVNFLYLEKSVVSLACKKNFALDILRLEKSKLKRDSSNLEAIFKLVFQKKTSSGHLYTDFESLYNSDLGLFDTLPDINIVDSVIDEYCWDFIKELIGRHQPHRLTFQKVSFLSPYPTQGLKPHQQIEDLLFLYFIGCQFDNNGYFLDLSKPYAGYGFYNPQSFSFENCIIDTPKLRFMNLRENSNFNLSLNFFNNTFSNHAVILSNCDMEVIDISGGNWLEGFKLDYCHWTKLAHHFVGMWSFQFLGLNFETHQELASDPKYAKQVYARLKEKATTDGDKQAANDFYFWQMYFHCKANGFFSLEGFYYVTSLFGLSVALPLLWLFLSTLVFFGLYYGMNSFSFPSLPSDNEFVKGYMLVLTTTLPAFKEALVFVKEEAPILWYRHAGTFLILLTLQVLMQLYLIFQIGSAIRNKVKR
jgi:hypothetical protein